MARPRIGLISAAIITCSAYPRPTKGSTRAQSNQSGRRTKPTDTRRGRAWIDRAAGVRIGYTLASISPGTPKTVLLIHGAPQTGYAWRKVVPTLVAAGYQVVVPHYRRWCFH